MSRRRRPPEPLAVLTDELAIVIEAWIEDHERYHPRRSRLEVGPFGTKGPLHYLGERWLVTESGVSHHWLMVVLHRMKPTVSLSVADELLCAIGRPQLLGTDIQLYANPEWHPSRVKRELERRGVESEPVFWREECPSVS